MSTLRRILRLAECATVAALLPLLSGCEKAGANVATPAAAAPAETVAVAASQPAFDPVDRGRYIVKTMGCIDCHSPKVMGEHGPVEDPALHMAGHAKGGDLPPPPKMNDTWVAAAAWDFTAWSGPWGISYAANLTPDENTGIGIWTEDMFVRALRTGKHMGQSRPILPPMPWEVYGKMTDEDLKAVYAYLRSIPPIHNRVPDPVPPSEVVTEPAIGG